MIEKFNEVLNLISIELAGLFIVFFAISFFWKKLVGTLSLKTYQSKQKLHDDEIPRIGGIIIYLFLSILALFSVHSNFLNLILISAIPIILIGSKEDLFHNTSPRLRLVIMALSAFLFFYLFPINYPKIDFPLFNLLFSIPLLEEIFFIFCIIVIINGNNLIDGVNGNMGLSCITQLLVIAGLAFITNDYEVLELCLILTIPLFSFLIFNFPLGKIFCGDSGAYFYGFAISLTIIYLFGKHDQLLSWSAVLILIYPSIELLFSFVRKKLFEHKSPFIPDAKHLHSLVFRYLVLQGLSKNNSYSLIFLWPFILSPLLTIYIHDDIFSIIFAIFTICFIYIFGYLKFLNKLLKND